MLVNQKGEKWGAKVKFSSEEETWILQGCYENLRNELSRQGTDLKDRVRKCVKKRTNEGMERTTEEYEEIKVFQCRSGKHGEGNRSFPQRRMDRMLRHIMVSVKVTDERRK